MNHFFVKQYSAIGITCLVSIVLGYVFFVMQSDTQQELQLLTEHTRTLRTYQQQKNILTKEVAQMNALSKRFDVLRQYVATPATTVNAVDSVKSLGDSMGLRQFMVTTQQDANHVMVTIDGAADAVSVARFLSELEHQQFQVNVVSTVFSKQSDVWHAHITASVPLYSYEEKK